MQRNVVFHTFTTEPEPISASSCRLI